MSLIDDGIVNPDRGFRVWLIAEVYPEGTNAPNVNDLVVNYDNGLLRCTYLDITTGYTTLEPWAIPETDGSDDVMYGVGPGPTEEQWRIYTNQTVIPYSLVLDSALVFKGSQNSHIKIFKGVNVNDDGEVISAYYNQNGTYIGENIPLELALTENSNNLTFKSTVTGYTNVKLQNGELVSVVVYNTVGGVSGIYRLLVVNSSFVRKSEASQRYITDVVLESPYMSETEDDTVLVPSGTLIDSLALRARVYYQDGTRQVLIDGNKTRLLGLNKIISGSPGQTSNMVLSYRLSPEEVSLVSTGYSERYINRPYRAKLIPLEGSYSVKLYPIPTWNTGNNTWRLEYWLYNLDRTQWYHATPYVTPNINTGAFDPTLYGTTQWLSVGVNLNALDPSLKPYRHVQDFGISLMQNGLSPDTSWLISFIYGQQPPYGNNLKAEFTRITVDNWQLRLDNGYTNFDDWLEAVYLRTLPLYDSSTEIRPPTPTHFILSNQALPRVEYSIGQWNEVLQQPSGGSPGVPVVIEWIRKSGNTVLQLGCSPLKIVQAL